MMHEDAESSSIQEVQDHAEGTYIKPSMQFITVTFSDGTVINLESHDLVVLVGPNNAGKSAALRELEHILTKGKNTKVLRCAEIRKTGTYEDVRALLERCSLKTGDPMSFSYSGYKFNITAQYAENWWSHAHEQFASMFCIRIPTETRITDSNPPTNIALLEQAPHHPIHVLQGDDSIEQRMSNYFRRAFGQALSSTLAIRGALGR